jgi:regulatory protein
MNKRSFTPEQALQKLRQYCAYQERSHYEVEQKLWELGQPGKVHATLIAQLIEEDYLNEERFAIQFAGGKFRMKDWGRKKILYALREKKVSEYSIKKALKEISEEDYRKTLELLAGKKYTLLEGELPLMRKKKTMEYLIAKGYEPEMVSLVVNRLSAIK